MFPIVLVFKHSTHASPLLIHIPCRPMNYVQATKLPCYFRKKMKMIAVLFAHLPLVKEQTWDGAHLTLDALPILVVCYHPILQFVLGLQWTTKSQIKSIPKRAAPQTNSNQPAALTNAIRQEPLWRNANFTCNHSQARKKIRKIANKLVHINKQEPCCSIS
jgi:hypothetical protein